MAKKDEDAVEESYNKENIGDHNIIGNIFSEIFPHFFPREELSEKVGAANLTSGRWHYIDRQTFDCVLCQRDGIQLQLPKSAAVGMFEKEIIVEYRNNH